MVDYIADYQARLEETAASFPVRAAVRPGYLRPRLPPAPPEAPHDLAALLADVEAHILPGITHWQSPTFFAWFRCAGQG